MTFTSHKRQATFWISVWIGIVVVISGPGCRGIRVDDVNVVADSDWRQDGGNFGRDRTTMADLQLPLEMDWRYNAAAAFGAGSPLFFGNTILLGTRRGDLYAVNIEKGRKKGSKKFAEAIEGALVTDGDIVYIPGALGKYNVMAYNLVTGKHVWRNKGIPIETGLVITPEAVIGTDISGTVTAYSRDNGVEIWSFDLPELESTVSAPILLPSGDLILAGEHGSLFKLNAADGTPRWSSSIPSPIRVSPSATDKSVFIAGARGVLYSVDLADGAIKWETKLGGRYIKLASPAISSGEIYIGTSEGKLFSLDVATGNTRWSFEGPDVFAAPPLVTQTHVFIGSMGRVLYAFNRQTKKLDWEVKLDGRIKSAMAARDGELFVLAEPRHIYKFISSKGANDDAD